MTEKNVLHLSLTHSFSLLFNTSRSCRVTTSQRSVKHMAQFLCVHWIYIYNNKQLGSLFERNRLLQSSLKLMPRFRMLLTRLILTLTVMSFVLGTHRAPQYPPSSLLRTVYITTSLYKPQVYTMGTQMIKRLWLLKSCLGSRSSLCSPFPPKLGSSCQCHFLTRRVLTWGNKFGGVYGSHLSQRDTWDALEPTLYNLTQAPRQAGCQWGEER